MALENLQKCLVMVSIFVSFIACAPSGEHKPVGSSAPNTRKGEKVEFEVVRPVLKKNCASCHPSKSAPDWMDEAQALQYVRNGKLLKRVVVEKTMPQVGSPESLAMTDAERGAIKAWVESVQGGGGGTGPGVPVDPVQGPLAPVEKCISCHGVFGDGPAPGVPYLAGQSRPYLDKQLTDYKSGTRTDRAMGAMNSIASALTPEEKTFVLDYFSRLKWGTPPSSEQIPDLERKLKRGEEIAKEFGCVSCHASKDGGPITPDWPRVVGQKRDYLLGQLKAFRDGQRTGTTMPGLVEKMTDDDLESLAVFIHRLGLGKKP